MTINISPKAPFDFELTLLYLNLFEQIGGPDSLFKHSKYWRAVEVDGKGILVSVQSNGTVESPNLVVTVEDVEGQKSPSEDQTQKVVDLVKRLLGVDQDLTLFYKTSQKDKVMADLVQRFRGLHLPQTSTVFECLSLTVLGQQGDFKDASHTRSALIKYGRQVELGGRGWRVFPGPKDIWKANHEDLLIQLGLNEPRKRGNEKVRRLRNVAGEALYGLGASTPLGLEYIRKESDGRARLKMQNIDGVGRWTPEWVLIRGLERPNALPLKDRHLERRLSNYYKEIPIGVDFKDYSERIKSIADLWSPYRSFGIIYLVATELPIYGPGDSSDLLSRSFSS